MTFTNHLCLFPPRVTRIIWEIILETISLASVTPAHPPIKRKRLVVLHSLRKGPQQLTCDHHRPRSCQRLRLAHLPALSANRQAAGVPAAQSRRCTVTGRSGRESKVTVILSTRLYFPSPTSWTHFPLSVEAAGDPYDNLLSHQLIVGNLFTSRGNDVTLHGVLTALHPSHVRCYPLVSCSVHPRRRSILISHSQL